MQGPNAPRMFDNGAQEYFNRFGGDPVSTLAQIAAKNHKHSVKNPYRYACTLSIRYEWCGAESSVQSVPRRVDRRAGRERAEDHEQPDEIHVQPDFRLSLPFLPLPAY